MKKLSLLLAVMLALTTFGGCGKDEKDDDNSRSTKKSSVSEDKDSSEDEKKDESKEFSRGIVTEDTYTNDYSGVNFELPEGWRFMSDDEIRQNMGNGLNIAGSDLDADTMARKSIYDCAACNMLTGENIIFAYEDLSRFADGVTADDYVNASKKVMSMTMPGVETEWDDDVQKCTLGGMDFDVYTLELTFTDYNISVKEEINVRRTGDYMLLITYSTGDPDSSLTDFAGCFKE